MKTAPIKSQKPHQPMKHHHCMANLRSKYLSSKNMKNIEKSMQLWPHDPCHPKAKALELDEQ